MISVNTTHLELAKLDLGRSGNDVCLVHPPEGNTVHLVGTGDQEQPARELLEEDDALPPEATREEDENGAGGDGGTELRGLGGFAALLGLTDILRRVETGSLLGGDDTLRAVLLAANGDLLGRRGLSHGGFLGFFLALEETAASKDGRTREAADAGDEFLAAGHLQETSVSEKDRSKVHRRVRVHPYGRPAIHPNPPLFHHLNFPHPFQSTWDIHRDGHTA